MLSRDRFQRTAGFVLELYISRLGSRRYSYWRDPCSNPGHIAPQTKSLTTTPLHSKRLLQTSINRVLYMHKEVQYSIYGVTNYNYSCFSNLTNLLVIHLTCHYANFQEIYVCAASCNSYKRVTVLYWFDKFHVHGTTYPICASPINSRKS